MNCHIDSLYLCVRDMDRAVRFYEDFFERKVLERDEIYSVFLINGFRLGLFAYERVGEEHSFGSNCLPSVSVESLELLKRKIENLEVCFPLTRIGDIGRGSLGIYDGLPVGVKMILLRFQNRGMVIGSAV